MLTDADWASWPDVVITVDCREVFGELIHLVRDDRLAPPGDGVVVRVKECRQLVEGRAVRAAIQTLVSVKAVFGIDCVPRPSRVYDRDEVQVLWEGWGTEDRKIYKAKRREALGLGHVDDQTATPYQRQLAASWAVEKLKVGEE